MQDSMHKADTLFSICQNTTIHHAVTSERNLRSRYSTGENGLISSESDRHDAVVSHLQPNQAEKLECNIGADNIQSPICEKQDPLPSSMSCSTIMQPPLMSMKSSTYDKESMCSKGVNNFDLKRELHCKTTTGDKRPYISLTGYRCVPSPSSSSSILTPPPSPATLCSFDLAERIEIGTAKAVAFRRPEASPKVIFVTTENQMPINFEFCFDFLVRKDEYQTAPIPHVI